MASPKLPHVSELNKITNSTFDFSKAEWSCQLINGEYQLSLFAGVYYAIDYIPESVWVILSPAGKRLILEATITTMALNLVTNWRNPDD